MTEQRKSILITGCSSGIGYDSAWTMQKRGWQVLATCRKQTDCNRLRAEGLDSFVLDYEDSSSVEAGFDMAMQKTNGQLDVCFNNGAYAIPAAIEDVPTDAMRQIFEANFFGWHHLSSLALKTMRAQKYGRIIINSSVLGFAALRFRGAYNSTKFALEGWADTLRLELADTDIDVVLIEPGPITTKIRTNSYPHFQKWIDWQNSALRSVYEKQLIPRLSAPENGPKDRFELPAHAVSLALVHACEAKRPKIRYRITKVTKIAALLKRLLPASVLDRLFVRL